MDEIVGEFLVESSENLDRLDRDLVVLEKNPTAQETLASIFRTIHTIKGTSGCLGFVKLEALTHAGESLLSSLRDGRLMLNAEITSALLAMVDVVRQMLARIESTGGDGDQAYTDLIATLTRLQIGKTAAEQALTSPVEVPNRPQRRFDSLNPTKAADAGPPEQISAEVQRQTENKEPIARIETLKECDRSAAAPDKDLSASAVAAGTIRVDVRHLDKLMNLVGELVLARNQILQYSTSLQDARFLNTSQRLNLITTELQEGVMKTRMQPIHNVWSKFPRIVRDVAMTCGKRVRLEMEGNETELDKTLIEAIKDPLTHLLRNSIDHGIECPEVREALGKPAEGRLVLRAFHESGQVNIEVSDDGAGINFDSVKRKAIERGLITPEQATRMSERETSCLLFLPGFSTAAKVTSVSGRGVGMDVVKNNIEKIGGTVEVESKQRKGTTVKIKIPLTLAIIPALIVTSGPERYAIPQANLLELVRLEGGQAGKGIEFIHGVPVYRLRGRLLPLVYLDRTLHRAEIATRLPSDDCAVNVVVLQVDEHQFGLIVDEINDSEEIVVKPLGKFLKKLAIFAGAMIGGDGHVSLILDVLELARRANVFSEAHHRVVWESGSAASKPTSQEEMLLLVAGPSGERMAIPLSSVTRLEEFSCSDMEKLGTAEAVQHHGRILPLVHISSLVPELHRRPRRKLPDSPSRDERAQVVVVPGYNGDIGLVVDRILDIVSIPLDIQRSLERKGVLGSAVVQGRVTQILNLDELLRPRPSLLSNQCSEAGVVPVQV